MASNTITLIGNLTRDPELRYTTGGRGVASFGLAVNRRYQQNGEWQEQTSFFNIVCWGELGENAAATLTKGARAIVTGRLEQRSWETAGRREAFRASRSSPTKSARVSVGRRRRSSAPSVPAAIGGFSGGGGGGGAGANREPDPVYGDEEPF